MPSRVIVAVLALAFLSFGVGVDSGILPKKTVRISVNKNGAQADSYSQGPSGVSSDGRYVMFQSWADDLVNGDTNGLMDVFVRDKTLKTTTRATLRNLGGQLDSTPSDPAFSTDGRHVAFATYDSHVVSGDNNNIGDVFLRDLDAKTTVRVSVDSNGVEGDGNSYGPYVSSDGRYVTFSSYSELVPGFGGGYTFVRDTVADTTEVVSVNQDGSAPTYQCNAAGISDDGNFVAFYTNSQIDPRDDADTTDLYLRDRAAGTTTLVTINQLGIAFGVEEGAAPFSSDGTQLCFVSAGDALGTGFQGAENAYVLDRTTGVIECASVTSSDPATPASGFYACISGDGRYVGFTSGGTNFVDGDDNNDWDVFLHDRVTGMTQLVSAATDGTVGDKGSLLPSISGDGGLVAFTSGADDLIVGDTDQFDDMFTRTITLTPASVTPYGTGYAGTLGEPTLTLSGLPRLNTTVDLSITNSAGVDTLGLLLYGSERADTPTTAGGHLMLMETASAALDVAVDGAVASDEIPADESLCGSIVDLQVLEVDDGAPHRVSFSAGLELVLGR